jgi:lysylphosphatidylglycerol synthetase-like protein (DUF2156 family)
MYGTFRARTRNAFLCVPFALLLAFIPSLLRGIVAYALANMLFYVAPALLALAVSRERHSNPSPHTSALAR